MMMNHVSEISTYYSLYAGNYSYFKGEYEVVCFTKSVTTVIRF